MTLVEFEQILAKVTLPLLVIEFTTLGGQTALTPELILKFKHKFHQLKEVFNPQSPLALKYNIT